MKIYRNIKISRKVLLSHKLRTVLALLGISIGIAAVIVVVALGEGAQSEIIEQIEEMGTNLLIVHAGQVKTTAGRIQTSKTATSLKLSDVQKILQYNSSVKSIAPAQSKNLTVKFGNYTTLTKILGTTEDFLVIRNFALEKGRIFTSEENRAALRVAVLGSQVRENLFGQEDPIGKIIRVRNIPFKVMGLLKAKGSSPGGGNQDNQIIIPIRTALRRVFNVNYLNALYLQVQSKDKMNLAETQTAEILREQHRLDRQNKEDDFTIQNQLRIIKVEQETRSSFTILIAGIAAISLLVGGIGILAIMFLSIKERTNEIGLRIAVGAKPKEILVQFLSEAMILGLVGGLLGLMAGILSAILLGISTQWHIKISIQPILFSILFSMSVGLFFGTYPARKAALMDPIEALHTE
jgi:putative ABC transport system permease protein